MSIPTLIVFKDGEVAEAPRRRQGQGSAAPGARRIPRRPLRALGLGDGGRGRPRPPAPASQPRATTAVARARRASATPPPRPLSRASSRPRGLRVDGICDAATLGRARRGRLPARRPAALPPRRRCCAATTSPSSSAGSARSASTPAASTASSAPRPRPRSSEFQRNVGLERRRRLRPDDTGRPAPLRQAARDASEVDRRVRERESLQTHTQDAPRATSGARGADELVTLAALGRPFARGRPEDSCSSSTTTTIPSTPRAANGFGADVYVGPRSRPPSTSARCAYYATDGFRSPGGGALARHRPCRA